jgi:hypothetical protein
MMHATKRVFLFVCLIFMLFALAAPAAHAASNQSAFCHSTDGSFTTCPDGDKRGFRNARIEGKRLSREFTRIDAN